MSSIRNHSDIGVQQERVRPPETRNQIVTEPSGTRHVFLEFAGRKHNVYDSLLQYPPANYEFIPSYGSWDAALSRVYASNWVYNSVYGVVNRLIPLHLAKGVVEKCRPSGSFDLTFATGHVVFREEPWVVDFENASQLAGYSYYHLRLYRGIIERQLASMWNKAILPWTEMSRRTILQTLNCKKIKEKITVVRHAVPLQEMHSISKKGTRMLFVGSSNYNYERDFIAKGGREVFALYDRLSRKYDEVYLSVRSRVPPEYHTRYLHDKHVRVIDEVLSWQELYALFRNSDLFVFPTHGSPARVFLDAMSFGLPIITTDVWSNREYVTSGKTGLVIPKSTRVPYLSHGIFPNTSSRGFMKALSSVDENLLADLYTATSGLIEDSRSQVVMSRNCYREVESGKFSIRLRNNKLREVFESAAKR